MGRRDLFEAVLDSKQLVAARRQQEHYEDFCGARGLSQDWISVAVYLTFLVESGQTSGAGLRRRLYLLDVASRIEGGQPPSLEPELRLYLRGLFKELGLGSSGTGIIPLYIELVRALADVCVRPTRRQVRDECYLLVANGSALSSHQLAPLAWQDVRLRSDEAVLNLRPKGCSGAAIQRRISIPANKEDRVLCAVRALRRWRRLGRSKSGRVFSITSGAAPHADLAAVEQRLRRICPEPSEPVPVTELQRLRAELLCPTARGIRDRAVILCAFAGALNVREVSELQRRDVREVERGLLLNVGRRVEAVAIPRSLRVAYCPVMAWSTWSAELAALPDPVDEGPAFVRMAASEILAAQPLSPVELNRILRQRCSEADLELAYSFGSLRFGFIRSAARARVPEHLIARQSGLATLASVSGHVRREDLIRDSVSARIGL